MESSTALYLGLMVDPTTTMASYFDQATPVNLSAIIPEKVVDIEWESSWENYSEQNIGRTESGAEGVQTVWNSFISNGEIGPWTFTDTHNGWQKLTQDCVMHLKGGPLCEMNIGLLIELVGQNEPGWPSKDHKAKFVRDLVRLYRRVTRPVYGVVLDLCRILCFRLDCVNELGVPQLFRTAIHAGSAVRDIMTRFACASPESLGITAIIFNIKYLDNVLRVQAARRIASGAQGVVYSVNFGDENQYFVKKFNRREFYDCEVVCLNKLLRVPGVPQIFGLDEACLAVMASSIGKRITKYRKSPHLIILASEFAGILWSIHTKGILHRDIRPSNVMVIDCGGRISPLIIDFGCAVDLDGCLKPYAGTIHYAAAEVLKQIVDGSTVIGAQSAYDLESLVLVMWELRCEEALRVVEIEHRQYGEILRWWREEAESHEGLALLLEHARNCNYEMLTNPTTWQVLF